jgi:hypothetical protein
MSDARLVVHCARCGITLSTPALELPGRPSPLREDDGADGLPSGVCFRVATDDVWNGAREGSVVIHLADLRNTIASGIRVGCCGPSGTDGPNLSCANGHVVGTEVADCWSSHFVFFDPAATIVRIGASLASDLAVVRVFGPDRALKHLAPFFAWLHEAVGATDWFGEDLGALVTWWLAAHPGTFTAVVHGAGTRRHGIDLAALVDAARAAHPAGQPLRFEIVVV